MEAFCFGKIQWQIMRQDPVPKLGLRAGNDVMCLGQSLKVICAAQHWVMIELLIPDLHHMQYDLRILRIILVPTVVQGLSGARQSHRRHKLHCKTGHPQPVRKGAVVIAAGLKCHADRATVVRECSNQAIKVVELVRNSQTAATLLTGNG